MRRMRIPDTLQLVLDRLRAAGYESFAVGGCVRDSLRGHTPADWDVTTSALPAQTIACFSDLPVIETGIKHGTVTVLVAHRPVEITTYRVDGGYSDGRRPDAVTFTRSLREDLARRDFTINAMAYSPDSGLADPFGGQADLAAGIIRAVGEADRRFGEDALRIMRALRFAAVLGFQIEPQTSESLRRNGTQLDRIARERIFTELGRLLCGDRAEQVCVTYAEVLQTAIGAPILAQGLGAFPRDPAVRLAALLRAQSPESAAHLLATLKCDNLTRRRCKLLLTHQHDPPPENRPALRRLLGELGEAELRLLLGFWAAQGKAVAPSELLLTRTLADGDCCTLDALAIDGNALLALGYRGRAVGDCLQLLLTRVIDGSLDNTPTALQAAARAASPPHAGA